MPNDDGSYQKGHTLPRPIVKGAIGNTRFVLNGDGTVTDLATGLMWVSDPFTDIGGASFGGIITWANAIIACEALVFATYDDWRLPNVKELMSIMDYEFALAIDAGIFPNFQDPAGYWTSTTDIAAPTLAHVVESDGRINTHDKTWTRWARPVRLGLPA